MKSISLFSHIEDAWRGDRAAECTALEMLRTRKRTEGSNPSLSARSWFSEIVIFGQYMVDGCVDLQQRILLRDMDFIRSIYRKLISILPSFDITNKSVLPYGLKPHTRSISWLVEQVVTQQSKFRARDLGIVDMDFDMPDTCLHDCVLKSDKNYVLNIKTHNADGKENKNDIAAVEKIYMQYAANEDYNVIYVCLGVHFRDIHITFEPDYLEVFTAQFLPVYVNSRNDKIQAFYKHIPVYRTRKMFLEELKNNSKSIALD